MSQVKNCHRCGERPRRNGAYCRECWAEYGREYRRRNPDAGRRASRRWKERNPEQAAERRLAKYGLTIEGYERLLEAQGGRCAICGARATRLHVDHDHACCPGAGSCGECVRGLLCGSCNRGLGHFGDDAEVLEAAVGYLRR